MWLLKVEDCTLKYFADPDSALPYLILSHTWGDEEATFDDITNLDLAKSKQGFRKIEYMRREAKRRNINYIWVDTCCIDKKSSAELSESINAMYRYYQKAVACCVYLEDFTYNFPSGLQTKAWADEVHNMLSPCRWFTRGWTLQELLAPDCVRFFDCGWQFIGDMCDLADIVYGITQIEIKYLLKFEDVSSASIARRMSWAAGRETSRLEDRAYSLLGIFNIHMPLIYGERDQAFRRLQQEIIKGSIDQTLFAWPGLPDSWHQKSPRYAEQKEKDIFASSPDEFIGCGELIASPLTWETSREYSISNVGLHISLPIVRIPGSDVFAAVLNCTYVDKKKRKAVALRLRPMTVGSEVYEVWPYLKGSPYSNPNNTLGNVDIWESVVNFGTLGFRLLFCDEEDKFYFKTKAITIARPKNVREPDPLNCISPSIGCILSISPQCDLEPIDFWPSKLWNSRTRTMQRDALSINASITHECHGRIAAVFLKSTKSIAGIIAFIAIFPNLDNKLTPIEVCDFFPPVAGGLEAICNYIINDPDLPLNRRHESKIRYDGVILHTSCTKSKSGPFEWNIWATKSRFSEDDSSLVPILRTRRTAEPFQYVQSPRQDIRRLLKDYQIHEI